MTTGETLAAMKIGDVMTTHVMAVMAGDSIQDAVKIMQDHELTTVPVVNTGDQCIGILSRSDLTEMFLEEDGALSQLLDTDRLSMAWFDRNVETASARLVNEVMTHNVTLVNATQTLQDACKAMVSGSFHHLPVVNDDERVVGFISTFDIVRAIASA
ncbi:MAG: CBS domain-containing protein [Pirellulaceae bacterium]